MNTRKRGCCPNCGYQLVSKIGIGSGRKKSTILEANGVKKHIDDWSTELNITTQAINYYRHRYKGMSFQEIYNRLKQGKRTTTPITNHVWRKKVKYD